MSNPFNYTDRNELILLAKVEVGGSNPLSRSIPSRFSEAMHNPGYKFLSGPPRSLRNA